jgi:hypothetical protein
VPNRDLTSLVRVWEKTSNGFKIRPLCVEDMKSNVSVVGELPVPEIYANYVLCTSEEKKWHQTQMRDILVPGVTAIDEEKIIGSGDNHVVSTFTDDSTVGMFWVFENKRGIATNSRSNYTTNNIEPVDGYGPMSSFSLSYKNFPCYTKADSDIFSRDQAYWFGKTSPDRKGYYGLMFSDMTSKGKKTEIHTQTGMNLTSLDAKATFAVKEPRSESTTRSQYELRLRILTQSYYRIHDGTLKIPSFSEE